jgi:hypothetical protein
MGDERLVCGIPFSESANDTLAAIIISEFGGEMNENMFFENCQSLALLLP